RRAAALGHSSATDLADYLVERGVPFREAHDIVGRVVVLAAEEGVDLGELALDKMRAICPAIGDDVKKYIALDACVAAKTSPGGTSPARVGEALKAAKKRWAAGRHSG